MSWLAKIAVSMEETFTQGITDSYGWHQKLWECFPHDPEKKRDFLTRLDPVEGAYQIWLLAQTKPICPHWCTPSGFVLKELAPTFLSHRYYAFDVRANPTKTIVLRGENGETLYRENGKRKHGKRIPLVKHDELKDWIIKKGQIRCHDSMGTDVPGGFRIVEERLLEIRPMTENYFRKTDKADGAVHRGYHGGVQFRGTLEITNQEHFCQTYYNGIGSAKGFGLGLFLLAPVKL